MGLMRRMQLVHISIIIVSYNTKEVTINCLLSVYQNHPKQPFEVIVVDNNSSDGSCKAIERDFPEVILIKNSENAGFAAANNQGIEISNGEYVLLLNPDTIVLPNALNKMLAFIDNNPQAGAVTSKKWIDEGKTIQSPLLHPFTIRQYIFRYTFLGKLFPSNTVFKKMWGKDIEALLSQEPLEVDCFPGSCMMVRRDVIKKAGLLDERFFMFFEDIDWCFRIKKAGYKLFLIPAAEIVHLVSQSPSGNLSKIYRSSMVYYLKKHYRRPVIWFLNMLLLFFRGLSKVLSHFNLGNEKGSEAAKLLTSQYMLHWPTISFAKKYILTISMDSTFINKGFSIVEKNSFEVPLNLLNRWPDGHYFWKIAPLYENGRIGEFSTPKIFKKFKTGKESLTQ